MDKRVFGIILIAPEPSEDQDGKLFMIQVPSGRWTLPGGAVPAGDTDEETLIRHIDRQTGQLVEVLEQFGPAQVIGGVETVGYLCTVVGGQLIETDEGWGDYVGGPDVRHLRLEDGSLTALGPIGRLVWDAVTMFDNPERVESAGEAIEGHFLDEKDSTRIVEVIEGKRLTWRRQDSFGPDGFMAPVVTTL